MVWPFPNRNVSRTCYILDKKLNQPKQFDNYADRKLPTKGIVVIINNMYDGSVHGEAEISLDGTEYKKYSEIHVRSGGGVFQPPGIGGDSWRPAETHVWIDIDLNQLTTGTHHVKVVIDARKNYVYEWDFEITW